MTTIWLTDKQLGNIFFRALQSKRTIIRMASTKDVFKEVVLFNMVLKTTNKIFELEYKTLFSKIGIGQKYHLPFPINMLFIDI